MEKNSVMHPGGRSLQPFDAMAHPSIVNPMKRSTLFGISIAMALTLGCRETRSDARSDTANAVGKLSAADLRQVVASLEGKVVLVNFWATWCGPCRVEIPSLVAIKERYGSDGLQILGLSIDEGPVENVAAFARENKLNYPVYVIEVDAAELWGSFESIPMTLLLDAQGKKVWEHEGLVTGEVLEKQIKPLLAQKQGRALRAL